MEKNYQLFIANRKITNKITHFTTKTALQKKKKKFETFLILRYTDYTMSLADRQGAKGKWTTCQL